MRHCNEIGRQIRLTPLLRSVPGSFADGRWYISEQSVPTSMDWKEFELKIADLDWSRFDVLNIDRGKNKKLRKSKATLSAFAKSD